MTALLDTTTATVDTPEGQHEVPGVLLSADDAALIGEVESWLSAHRLYRKLWCRECGPDVEVEAHVTPEGIGFVCQHRVLFYQGLVPVVLTNHPHAGETIAVTRFTVPEVPLLMADAFMQRKWDKFLKAFGLREALWCLQCEDEGNASGTRVMVNAQEVTILCRHAHRVFRGLTL